MTFSEDVIKKAAENFFRVIYRETLLDKAQLLMEYIKAAQQIAGERCATCRFAKDRGPEVQRPAALHKKGGFTCQFYDPQQPNPVNYISKETAQTFSCSNFKRRL